MTTTTTTPTSGAADLLDLIEAYAEARHRQGHSSYNAQTATAPQAVKDALAAGQATAQQVAVAGEWPTNEMIDAGRKAAASQGRLLGSGQSLWHVFRAMLAAAPAQPVAQQGVAYAALPTSSYAGRVYEEGFLIGTCPLYTADQLHAFADATHTLRASHVQAPAGAGEAAEHYRNAIARARLLDSDLSNLTERGAKAWAGVDAQGLRDGGASPSANAGEPSAHIKEPYTLAEIKAKIDSNDYSAEMLLQHAMLLLDSVQEDAARYRFLRDGEWRDTDLEPFIRLQLNTLWDAKIDAAMADAARAAQKEGS